MSGSEHDTARRYAGSVFDLALHLARVLKSETEGVTDNDRGLYPSVAQHQCTAVE
jgi:hypothetical protein